MTYIQTKLRLLAAFLGKNKLGTWSLDIWAKWGKWQTHREGNVSGTGRRVCTKQSPCCSSFTQNSWLRAPGGNQSTTSLPASALIRDHAGRLGNLVHRQENDESPKQSKFNPLAYRCRERTGNAVALLTHSQHLRAHGSSLCPSCVPPGRAGALCLHSDSCLPTLAPSSVAVVPEFLTAIQTSAHSQHRTNVYNLELK